MSLRILFVVGLLTIMSMGAIIFIQIQIFEDRAEGEVPASTVGGINPALLCENVLFQVFHAFPFLFVGIFYIAFRKIRFRID